MVLSRRQALTVLLAVLPDRARALRATLSERASAVEKGLAELGTLHFARLVLVPPADSGAHGDAPLLLVELTFDGDARDLVRALWLEVGQDLGAVLAHCEGVGSPSSAEDLERVLSERAIPAGAWLAARPGLTVARIREDARLRDHARRVLDRDRAELVRLEPKRILERLQRELQSSLAGAPDELARAASRSPPQGPGPSASALAGLFANLVLSFLYEARDLLARLWHDAPSPIRPPPTRARVARVERGRAAQRSFTHVVELLPGGFRRRTLRRVLVLIAEATADERALDVFPGLHSARFVLTGDGRLLFTAQHDGSVRALIAGLGLLSRAVVLAIWAGTRAFPYSLSGMVLRLPGGERLHDFAAAHELEPALSYSAYPMQTELELGVNAELRSLLLGEASAAHAARFLQLL